MHKYLVNLYNWESPRVYSSPNELEEGDVVIVEGEFGGDIGKIKSVEVSETESVGMISRRATKRDLEVAEENEKKGKEIYEFCCSEAKRMNIPLKIIDAHIVYGKGNVLIVFIADGRVDFRDFVKSISHKCHRSIRMQQIGSRDEARQLGGCGTCGRELCCVKFPGNIPSITTDMARVQQVSHRGSERISGLCGRLLCCLSYESEQYKELMKGMPELHSTVEAPEGKGEVLEINALKQEVRVRISRDQVITIKKENIK